MEGEENAAIILIGACSNELNLYIFAEINCLNEIT